MNQKKDRELSLDKTHRKTKSFKLMPKSVRAKSKEHLFSSRNTSSDKNIFASGMLVSKADKQNVSTVAMSLSPYNLSLADFSTDAPALVCRDISIDKLKSREKKILSVVLMNASSQVKDLFNEHREMTYLPIVAKNELGGSNRNKLMPEIKDKYSKDASMVSFMRKPSKNFKIKHGKSIENSIC